MWIILIIFLFCLSFYMAFKSNFRSYRVFSVFKSIRGDKSSLFMSLGTKMGVGSIIGTASSIIIGGYSSVIWMIIFSFVTSSLIYCEAYLGRKYRVKSNNNYISGMYYAIRNGLGSKLLSFISLITLILLFSFCFQMIQANTISNILYINYEIDRNIVCIGITALLAIMFLFSIKDVISVMNKLVPLMCILFLIISIYGIFSNIDLLIYNISNIEIFNIKSIMCGLVIGVKRSIFMNETLVGTTSISSGIDDNDLSVSSNIQVLGNYFISFVITVLICLLLLIYNPFNVTDYNVLISDTYLFTSGKIGLYILSVVIILFGVTTMLSGYYIGKSNLTHIFKSKAINILFNILFFAVIITGIYINNIYIWKYLDIIMFIMILINSYSIIKLMGSEKI